MRIERQPTMVWCDECMAKHVREYGVTKTAKFLGLTVAYVSKWINFERRISEKHVLKLTAKFDIPILKTKDEWICQ